MTMGAADQLHEVDATFRSRTIGKITKIVLVIALLGAVGVAIKAPWGVHLMTIAGKPPAPHPSASWWQWLAFAEWGRLIVTAIFGLIFYRYADFRPAPLIEARMIGQSSPRWMDILRPALIIALILMALTFVALILSQTPPLATKIVSGVVPHEDAMKLLWLWPLGFLGAGLSEEVLYRFGMIVPIAGLICLIAGPGRPRTALAAFWIANVIQALYFGWGHVDNGVVASASGGWIFATLAAPQTWVGLLFGYIFRRWGLECAILCHALTDFLVPGIVILWAFLSL